MTRRGLAGDLVSAAYALLAVAVVVMLLIACVTRWVTYQPCPPVPVPFEVQQLPTLSGVAP